MKTLEGEGFIFTHKGRVQHWVQDGRRGMLVATTHDAARRMKRHFRKKVSIAAIGTVPGETLEGQFAASRLFGATGIWFTDGEILRWAFPLAKAA